jgi:O-antigen ligase
MFLYAAGKLAEGYRNSFLGGFWTSIQAKARKAWDASFLGGFIAGENNEEKRTEEREISGALGESVLFWIITRYEWWAFLLVALVPFAPTMVCAGIAVLAIFGWIVRGARIGEGALPKLVLAFMVITFLYAITSYALRGSVQVWALYAAFISMFFIVFSMVDTEKRLFWMSAIFAIGGFLVSVLGILQHQTGFGANLGHAWIDEEMFASGAFRVTSTFGNPNVLGTYLLLVIPITVGLMWNRIKEKKWISSILFAGCVGAMLLCMIFTQSRGCWLSLMVTALVFVIFVDKRFFALFVIGLMLAPIFAPPQILDRFMSIGNLGDSSTSYRVFIWLGTLNMLDDFWLYGIGLGEAAFAQIYPFYRFSGITTPHAHNIYLQAMVQMGIVGLVALISMIVLFLGRVLCSYVNSEEKDLRTIITVSCMAGVVGFMMQGAFDYVWYNYRVFLIFWMVLALGSVSVVRREDKK